MLMGQTFRRQERLTSSRSIGLLSKKGESIKQGPLKLIWSKRLEDNGSSVKTAVSVPKSKFKRATDRNKLKRRIREAYRKNKKPLTDHLELKMKKISLLIVYQSGTIATYESIETAIKNSIVKIIVKS